MFYRFATGVTHCESFTSQPQQPQSWWEPRNVGWRRGEEGGGRKQHIRLGALRFCLLTSALKARLSNLLFCSEGLWGLPAVFTLRRRGEMKYMYLDEDRWKIFLFPLLLFCDSLCGITLLFQQASHQFLQPISNISCIYKMQMKDRPCLWCSGCRHLSE